MTLPDGARRRIAVTLATAHPSDASATGNPALTSALAIAVIAAATLAGAWFFQLVLEIMPVRSASSSAMPITSRSRSAPWWRSRPPVARRARCCSRAL